MTETAVSRRSVLQAIAAAMACAAVPLDWAEVEQKAGHNHSAPLPHDGAALSFFSTADAADVEAVAAQVVPTDDAPGAREAGVIHFIDRALATFLSRIADDYRAQLAGFQQTCRDRHGAAASFAALTSAQQIAHLRQVEQTPFFITTRLLTLLGMFSRPEYGGNRGGAGWKLLGFEDAHAFLPPFGYYDRSYPGFVISPGRVE